MTDLNKLLAPYLKDTNSKSEYKFTLISRIGQVYDFKNQYRYKKEFLLDEKIGDFVMPKNSNKSIFDLAKIYGFYESSNGINVKGKEISVPSNYSNNKTFQAEEPALVGDIFIFRDERRLLIDTINRINTINTKTGDIIWDVSYEYVIEKDFNHQFNYQTEITDEDKKQPEYYKSLYDTKDVIKKEVFNFINIFEETLKNCSTITETGTLPLTLPFGFNDTMKTLRDNFIYNIDTALENEKKSSY